MPSEVASEQQLYKPTRRFLSLAFPGLLEARSAGATQQVFADIVSTRADSAGGRWTRPDLACVVISRGEYVPYIRADLHTFEVKTVGGLDETALHEAHAHGRFGQYAWLVFQAVGIAAPAQGTLWARVETQATNLGIGLICFSDAEDPNDWRVYNWPRRTGTDLAMADRFVRERFSAETKDRISGQLAAMGWRDL